MKTVKIFSVAIFLLLFQNGFAQSKSDKMYDAFSGKEGISEFSFSKSMIDAIDIDLGDDGDEKRVTGDLHQIRFMSYNPKKGSLSGSEFTKKTIGYLPKSAYKKYEGEDDEDAEIWLAGGKKKFSECHFFLKNQKEDQIRIVVSFYGNFRVNDLKSLKEAGKNMAL
ncbi:MAG: DUF4252 domain-containing protein [Bacteroidales bacterium]|nr:DUF4252 domain-containing protein [Bacteroidales bacterium]